MPRKKVRDNPQDPFKYMTEEEVEEFQRKRIAAYRETVAKRTPAQKASIRAKKKMTWNQKSAEEQKDIRTRQSEIKRKRWASRSIEERLAIAAKISASVRKAKREGRFFNPREKKKGE